MLTIWEEEDAYWNNILKKEKISAYHSCLGKDSNFTNDMD